MKKIYKFLLNSLPRPILIRLSYIFKIFAPLIYKGDAVECPVCDKKFKKFLSYGSDIAHRENVLCPYDLTLERHRLMWLFLKNESDFFSSKKLEVLHIAPEQCFYSLFKKQKNLKYLTGDLVSPLADLHFDLHEIPLEENTFDVVFCNHVLEHVNDAKKCMSELYRVLKPGGMGIFQIPQDLSRDVTFFDDSITNQKERAAIFGQYDHVRIYGRDYFDKLRSIGFNVVEEDYTNKIKPELVKRYCLAKGEIIPICYK